MPITLAQEGVILKVVKILSDEKNKKHLESLGITVGSELNVLNSTGGSVIVTVKDGRLAIDRDMANKILVA